MFSGFSVLCVCTVHEDYLRAMAGNWPYFPKLAYNKPGKISYQKITSSSVN